MTKTQNTKNPRVIHPYPNQVEWNVGLWLTDGQPTLNVADLVSEELVAMFRETWSQFTLGAGCLEICQQDMSGVAFALSADDSASSLPSLDSGSTYALCVDATGVAVQARDETSLRHAWLTLLQLIEPHCLEPGHERFGLHHVDIQDRPAVAFRGLHLCVFPETELHFLDKVISLAGLMKYSHIVLEFWGTLKLDALAELAWPKAYTKEQIKPLIEKARSFGVEVVPMINHWGHATASRSRYGRHVVLDQNPRLATLFEPDGWTWCLSNPKTRELLAAVRRELIELCGPGQYFHIGCDEAYSHGTCDQCRKVDSPKLLANHVNAVAADLKSLGRRPIMWGDALLEAGAWEKSIIATSRADQRTHEAIDLLSRDIVIADWQYRTTTKDVASLTYFQEKGFEVLACPWHDNENVRSFCGAAVKHHALGALATTWHTLPDHMPLIPLAAGATWLQDDAQLNLPQYEWSFMSTMNAANLRKLVPANSDYSKAGWNSGELTSY
jgi:hypothetical protein